MIRICRTASLLAILAGLAAMALPAAGHAQSPVLGQFSRSYITPFPPGNQYRLVVLGDSLGDGIWSGLYRVFKEDANVEVIKRSRVSTGFARTDYFDWNANLDGILRSEPVHIAVVMVGANDVQAIFDNRRWYKLGTEQWRQVYGDRIDGFIRKLKESHAAVYWVGLPIMRSEQNNQTMQTMNEIFREKAFINGVKFIDTWNAFADEFGRYSAYGPDLTGQVRRLRAEDGVHFTIPGYVKLAHFVEREIRRDLRVARAERNIPLAGSEEEQARTIHHARSQPAAVASATRQAAKPAADAAAEKAEASPEGAAEEGGAAEPGSNAAKKVAKAIPGLDLVRPALSESAAAAAASSDYSPPGEAIAHNIGFGLTALATISPVNDPNVLVGQQQLPLTQRPYYRVLIQGEQLKPKTGRADDFAWPGS